MCASVYSMLLAMTLLVMSPVLNDGLQCSPSRKFCFQLCLCLLVGKNVLHYVVFDLIFSDTENAFTVNGSSEIAHGISVQC